MDVGHAVSSAREHQHCVVHLLHVPILNLSNNGRHSPAAPTIDAAGYLEGTSYLTVNNGNTSKAVYGLRSEVRLLFD